MSTQKLHKAYDPILENAVALKQEYDRTLSSPEIAETLARYKNRDYLWRLRDAILAGQTHGPHQHAYVAIPIVAQMFMAMVTQVLPSRKQPSGTSFREFLAAFDITERQKLLRFAYIATVSEQQKATDASSSAVAYSMLVILAVGAASADPSPPPQQIANQLIKMIEELSRLSPGRIT